MPKVSQPPDDGVMQRFNPLAHQEPVKQLLKIQDESFWLRAPASPMRQSRSVKRATNCGRSMVRSPKHRAFLRRRGFLDVVASLLRSAAQSRPPSSSASPAASSRRRALSLSLKPQEKGAEATHPRDFASYLMSVIASSPTAYKKAGLPCFSY